MSANWGHLNIILNINKIINNYSYILTSTKIWNKKKQQQQQQQKTKNKTKQNKKNNKKQNKTKQNKADQLNNRVGDKLLHIKQSLQVLHIRFESSTDLMRFLKMSTDSDDLIYWLSFDQITGPK